MNKLNEFVVQSTKDYLQSIVYVDDNIYDRDGYPGETEAVAVGIGNSLRPQTTALPQDLVEVSDDLDTGQNDENQVDQNSAYHPRKLMESFAQKGMACALYEPPKGFKVESDSEIHRLCKRADVIILDWALYNDDGDAVSSLLSLLIKESQSLSPHQVRLCAIYTDKPDLHGILHHLSKKLEKDECTVDEEKLQLVAGATRISIFGKPDVTSRPPNDKPYEVRESDLADRIIDEFAQLHYGFLSAFALHGLAAVRRNTKRLIDKFSQGLDGPFFLDQALVFDDPTDFFDELPELLGDEIRAVIEDSWPININLNELAEATIDGLSIIDPTPPWTNMEGREIDAKPILRNLLKRGKGGIDTELKQCPQLKHLGKLQGFRGVNPDLLTTFESMLTRGDSTHCIGLASLFCARTHYNKDTRNLHFGTIVRHKEQSGDAWQFSLCLMPICDSQRLKKNPTIFPFWNLDTLRSDVAGKKHGIAIIDPEGETQSLAAGGKIRDKLWLTGFEPDNGRIVATSEEGVFQFPSNTGVVEWAGELKPLHAQRIAAHLGAEASRVGLVESERLRLLCDR